MRWRAPSVRYVSDLVDTSCSSCIRSYQFLARTQPDPIRDAQGVQCFYDDENEEEHTPKRKAEEIDPRLTVHQLEAKVGEYLWHTPLITAELQNALILATHDPNNRSAIEIHPDLAGLIPAPSERLDAEAGQLGGPFAEVFWPGWPHRLPTPSA